MTDFQGLFQNYSSSNAIVWKNEAYTYGFILNFQIQTISMVQK